MVQIRAGSQPTALQDHQAVKGQVDLAVSQFPNRLRQFRESLQLSQWSFAQLIGVSETTVYHLERDRLPTFRTYTAILLLGFRPPGSESDGRQPNVFEAKLSGFEDDTTSELWSNVK